MIRIKFDSKDYGLYCFRRRQRSKVLSRKFRNPSFFCKKKNSSQNRKKSPLLDFFCPGFPVS
ncbi:hypothetical protein DLM78_19450 [Leptospira stimsonii]|uniref:Uncharacterized protein n=1 Tax=Leptospira stimsonii TaxID=2202203 RepID=A0A8B3CM32_9LEPT|nr:hypothetical protein DLM78_19450 [Leptospira stimsonii]